jgi:predicted CopG family antitoxin
MVKVISLSDKAYNTLIKLKRNRSFSELVIDLIEGKQKKNIRNFAGWISKEDGEKWKKEIVKTRKQQKTNEVKF